MDLEEMKAMLRGDGKLAKEPAELIDTKAFLEHGRSKVDSIEESGGTAPDAPLAMWRLEYTEGKSDKVYFVTIHKDGPVFRIVAEWGRRGKTRKNKVWHVTNEAAARREVRALVDSKLDKGYKPMPAAGE